MCKHFIGAYEKWSIMQSVGWATAVDVTKVQTDDNVLTRYLDPAW